MDKLIELLQQIQELAGVAVDALQKAAGGGGHEGQPGEEHSEPPAEAHHEPPQEAKSGRY